MVFEAQLSTVNISPNTYAIRFQTYADYLPKENQFLLSENGNLNEAAANLFSTMRKLDAMQIDLIIAERFPTIGIGRAINDRLERATSKNLHS
jgi:L-threonylcarbamoyladenylate synthase